MNPWNAFPALAVAAVLAFGVSGASARDAVSSEDYVEGIIRDVIDRTIDAARDEVRRNTGIDPLERGYDPSRKYRPAPANASRETHRELRQLNAEHDRKIAKLEDELRRKLDKAEAEFEREAAKEDKPEKVDQKRDKLQEKVDEVYAKFEEKIGDENHRFDEKRDDILRKSREG